MRNFVPSRFVSSQLPYYFYRVRASRPVSPLKVSLFSFPSSLQKPYTGFYLPYKHTLRNAFFYDFSYKYFFLNWRRYEIRQSYSKLFKTPSKFPNFIHDFTHFYDFKASGFKSRYFKKKYRSFLFLKTFMKQKRTVFRSFRLSPKRFDKRKDRSLHNAERLKSPLYFRKGLFGSSVNKLRMFHTKWINRYKRRVLVFSILAPIIRGIIIRLNIKIIPLKHARLLYVIALNTYGAAFNKVFRGRGFIFKAINFYNFISYKFLRRHLYYYLRNPIWRIYFNGIGGRFRGAYRLTFYIKRVLLYKRFFNHFNVLTPKLKCHFLIKRYFPSGFFRSKKKQSSTDLNFNLTTRSSVESFLVTGLFRSITRIRALCLLFDPARSTPLLNGVISYHVKKFFVVLNLVKLKSKFTLNNYLSFKDQLFKKFDLSFKFNQHVTVKRKYRSRFWSSYFRRYTIRLFRFFTFYGLMIRCLIFSKNSQLFFRLRKKFIVFLYKFAYNGKDLYALFFSFYRHLYFGLTTPPISYSFMYSLPEYNLVFKNPKMVTSRSNLIQFNSQV